MSASILVDCILPGDRAQENRAFTDRVIRRLQRETIRAGLFQVVLTEYLMGKGRISYDRKRDLFWVLPTAGSPQVAVWMMPLVNP